MLRKNVKSSEYRSVLSTKYSVLSLFIFLIFCGCDRGASEQIQAAQKFADAVTRNDVPARDSMIATRVFKKYFDNPYVSSDYIEWMRTIYDMHNKKFFSTSRADVDRDLKTDLNGGLINDGEIEETGMVRVKAQSPDEQAAYFWMVKQKGRHWAVAIVTKGEAAVNFK
jgi:hypothetical protein